MGDPYVGPTIFESTVSANPYSLQMGISDEDLKRVRKELLHWKFYRGNHWSYKRPEGEPQNTFNYCAKFVDKGVSFLMGKGFTINVERGAEEIVKKYLDMVWDDNQRELLALEMAQAGGVTGNAWVKVVHEEYDPEEEPLMAELYPKGRIRLILLPGHTCFPTWDNHDKDKMTSIKIIYPIYIPAKNDPNQLETHWYREEITNKVIKEYLDDELIEEYDNELGIIPVIRIKNIAIAHEPLGKSDLEDIIPINKELNEKTTDISDIINYHAAPVTLIFGAKASNLEKGARKVWGGLPKDARVENLELKSELAAAMNYITLLKESLFEIASMPQDALGAKTNISNTSGIALHIKNQPLMDLTKMKRQTYGEGIEEVCRVIMRYLEVTGAYDFPVEEFKALKPRQKWVYSIEFGDPLPKDELIQMQLIAQRLTHQLITRLDALKMLGEHDAEQKLEEIKKEFLEWQQLMFESMPQNDEDDEPNIGGIVRREEKANPEPPEEV